MHRASSPDQAMAIPFPVKQLLLLHAVWHAASEVEREIERDKLPVPDYGYHCDDAKNRSLFQGPDLW